MSLRQFSVCTKCASPLALRGWSEPAGDGEERCVWSCLACRSEFETLEKPGNAVGELDKVHKAVDAFWPTLLVA